MQTTKQLFIYFCLMVFWIVGISFENISAIVLKFYHIDVDQGDATLIVSPNGNSLLVDSGKNGDGARLKNIMDIAGVTKINHFVCTHYHEDHYGGIDELVLDQEVIVEKSNGVKAMGSKLEF